MQILTIFAINTFIGSTCVLIIPLTIGLYYPYAGWYWKWSISVYSQSTSIVKNSRIRLSCNAQKFHGEKNYSHLSQVFLSSCPLWLFTKIGIITKQKYGLERLPNDLNYSCRVTGSDTSSICQIEWKSLIILLFFIPWQITLNYKKSIYI